MTYPANTTTLVADIGGTNTRVALALGSQVIAASVRRYPNKDFPGLATVLRKYIADQGTVAPRAACVAIAGPVRQGIGHLTNLDWHIDEATLRDAAGSEHVFILNDLQAQAYALGHISTDKLVPVLKGVPAAPNTAMMVVGVGTGFNAAPVYQTPKGRIVPPSEAGHANLPVRTADDLDLCRFIEGAHGFAAVEDVLSGRGLERIYAWLGSDAGSPQDLAAADIMAACRSHADPYAERAVQVFIKTLGTVCGNLTLINLPFGGIYLVGGVARAMAPYLSQFGFEAAFRDKGRFADFMTTFSVTIVEDDYAALTGCAAFMVACEASR